MQLRFQSFENARTWAPKFGHPMKDIERGTGGVPSNRNHQMVRFKCHEEFLVRSKEVAQVLKENGGFECQSVYIRSK